MKYLETGNFTLNLEKLPSLRILPRALMSRSSEVEIFIGDHGIYLYAHDLSSDIRYVAQESNVEINVYKKSEGIKLISGSDNNLDDDGDDLDLDDLDLSILDDDLFSVDMTQRSSDILQQTMCNQEEVRDREYSSGEDVKKNLEDLNKDIPKDATFCRFATSSDIIKVFGLFKEVNIDISETEVTVSNNTEGTVAKFPRTKSYSELDKIKEMVREFSWEDFPLERVKSVLPLIEKIEPKKYKQSLSIMKDKLYTFSDTVAIETGTESLSRDYALNSEVIRILKYSTNKNTDVKISQNKKRALALYVDSLIVLFGPMQRVAGNLFDIPRAGMEKEPFIESVSKDFMKKLTTMSTIFPNNDLITITTWDNLVVMNNERMQSIFIPGSRVSNGKRIVSNIEQLSMALKLSGSDNPTIALYKLKDNRAILVIEGIVSVLINIEEYYSGIKEL